MNISEILRKLADTIDQQSSLANGVTQDATELSPTAAGTPVETPQNQDVGANDDIMVPPLQLKVELLKRAVGVDNIYDGARSDEVNNTDDELAAIKRIAGVPVAAVQELSNDEIVDD